MGALVRLRCGTWEGEVEAVLFDKDGTLAGVAGYLRRLGSVRSHLIEAQVAGIGGAIAQALGIEGGIDGDRLNPAGLMAIGSRYENEIGAAAYVAATGMDWPEAITLVKKAFQQGAEQLGEKAPQTPLLPGASEMLGRLKSAGLRVAIISADVEANIQAFVEHYQLQDYIDGIFGADSGLPPKPDPALVLAACEQLGVDPRRTLMVGDSALDLAMARGAGLAGAIAYTRGWDRAIEVAGGDASLTDWSEVEVLAPPQGPVA
jgi:phosphoglycolate phosphatase